MFLFRDILLICEEMGLLDGTKFSLDGLKLSSNASKEWSGTKSDLKKKKQIEKLKAKAEKIEKWLLENEGRQGKRGKEIQSNITDNQSAKMKTSPGVIQGCNGQALVDPKHQIIVHAGAFGNGQDTLAYRANDRRGKRECESDWTGRGLF